MFNTSRIKLFVVGVMIALFTSVSSASAAESKFKIVKAPMPKQSKIKTNRSALDRGGLDQRYAWFTLDDCGSKAQINRQLKLFKKHNVRVIYFLTGQCADDIPGTIKKIVRDGHLLGNHSNWHPPMGGMSWSSCRSQLRGGVRGNGQPSLFRPPFGHGIFNYSTTMVSCAKSLGYQVVGWTIDTNDWKSSTSAGSVRSSTCRAKRGDVVLVHANNAKTNAVLESAIRCIKKKMPPLTIKVRRRAPKPPEATPLPAPIPTPDSPAPPATQPEPQPAPPSEPIPAEPLPPESYTPPADTPVDPTSETPEGDVIP